MIRLLPVADRLQPHHLAELRRSGLSDEQIIAAGICSSENHVAIANNLNRPFTEVQHFGPCLAFPFIPLDRNWQKGDFTARYKPDQPPTNGSRKPCKYLSPTGKKGKPNRL